MGVDNDNQNQDYIPEIEEVRIAVMGNVDAGKSTLLGVLKSGELDDGNGKARSCIFKHPHEQESGRTSSVSHHYFKMGNKLLTFVDLAGHEKYLKTTLYGVNGSSVSYVMLMISASDGIIGTTKEHLEIALALRIPLFIVVTKLDQVSDKPEILSDNLQFIKDTIKKKKRILYDVKSTEDVTHIHKEIKDQVFKVIPLFQVSNKIGTNINLIKDFFENLPQIVDWIPKRKDPNNILVDIQDTYFVDGIGLVLYVIVKRGVIRKDMTLQLGPIDMKFKPIIIKSIHNNHRELVDYLTAGCSGCIAIKSGISKDRIRRNDITKGMVVTSNPFKVQYFDALVQVIHHPTSIKIGYQPTIHCGTILQTAEIIDITKIDKITKDPIVYEEGTPEYESAKLLRAGDLAKVKFKLMHHVEYLEEGSTIFFREGQTKGLGKITSVDTENFIPFTGTKKKGGYKQRIRMRKRTEQNS